MRRSFIWVAATFIVAFVAGSGAPARAQGQRAGTVIVPPSNVLPPQDRGTHAHTNFLIFRPSQGGNPAGLVGISPAGETPSSLACVYQVGSQTLDANTSKNCPVSYSSNYDNPGGGSNIIAIVDAYDYPTAANDFDVFSNKFGLPLSTDTCANNNPCFRKAYPGGSQPRSNGGWAQEEALDIEWAHAMAPHAQIVLVEAASNSNADLMQAVLYASNIVATCDGNCSSGGVGEVSMSWGSSESSSQISYDPDFITTPGITYFASSGDSGGKVIWPSSSPYVVSAGGTTVNRTKGNFTSETTWSSAGGGPSHYETMPTYQDATADINTTQMRGTPDISFDANPSTGVSVYDSTASQGLSGWLVFGGTSVSSPSLAGIVNNAEAFGDGSNTSVLNNLYSNYTTETSSGTTCAYGSSSSTSFYDITSGSAGTYNAGPCWDFASGIGSLRGLTGPTGSGSNNGGGGGTNITVSSLTLGSTSVTGGDSTTGTVTLSTAPSSGTTVVLSSNSSYVSVPTGVTVLAGHTSATFPVTTSSPPSITIATITATYPQGSPGVTAQLAVSPASTGGSFTVAAGDFSLTAGSTASTTVTVTSSGFSGSVTLSVSGLPKFANASFSTNPVSVPANATATSILTVRTNKNVVPNSSGYTLTITGTSGSQTSTTSVTLVVNQQSAHTRH